jgi:hypothetical protein
MPLKDPEAYRAYMRDYMRTRLDCKPRTVRKAETKAKRELAKEEKANAKAARHAEARRWRYERWVAENQWGIDALKQSRSFEDEVKDQLGILSKHGTLAGIMAHIESLKQAARAAGGRWALVEKWDNERKTNAALEAWRRMNEIGWAEDPEKERQRLAEIEWHKHQDELREKGRRGWGGWEPARAVHVSEDAAVAELLPAI